MVSCRSFKAELFFTLPLCVVIVALVCTAMITESWFVGKGIITNRNDSGQLPYHLGLFKGYKEVQIPGSSKEPYSLSIVCKSGKCIYSCAKQPKKDISDMLSECPLVNNIADGTLCNIQEKVKEKDLNDSNCEDQDDVYDSAQRDETKMMMSHDTWAATVAFIVLGLLFTLLSAVMGGWNAFSNPVEMLVGPYGVAIWNGIAALCYFLVICIWAGEYHVHLKKSAPISQVIREGPNLWSTEGHAGLGYSYWLILCVFFLHLANIAIVVYYIYRKYNPKMKKKKVIEDNFEKGPEGVILY